MDHSKQAILALPIFHKLSLNLFSLVMQKYMPLPKIGKRRIITI
jgi:hypothetical protein